MIELNKIYNEDCLEGMKRIPDKSVDAIVTDPPFVMAGGISNGRSSEFSEQFFLHWWKDVCVQLDRVLKDEGAGFIWCDWRSAMTMARGFEMGQRYNCKITQMLYHYREMPGQGAPFRNSVDMIAYLRGCKANRKRIPNTTHNMISKYWYYGKHKHHPAEKDTEIACQLVKWCSDENSVVLDPFMGSGTTAIACINTNRNFIGFELDKHYCEIANERIRKALAEKEVGE
jgi:site-specific DNA-methyltransferase (adenine-specific)